MRVSVYGLNNNNIYNGNWKYERCIRYVEYADGYWNRYVRSGELKIEVNFRYVGWAWWSDGIPVYGNNRNGDIGLWV